MWWLELVDKGSVMSKKLLLLGGTRYLLPVIESAHDLGCEVVTCDYLPDNIAHQYSDAYVNASIVDKDAVLQAAEQVKADGIMSFAADPGVVAASYAAEKLGLPFQGSYDAVQILQNKGRFRGFLRDHGFNCPFSYTVSSIKESIDLSESLVYPVIVKPVDSAGSKGVSKVESNEEMEGAVRNAMAFSISGQCIIEQFIEKQGDSSDSDGFLVNGEPACISFSTQLFDLEGRNPYVPAAYVMPSSISSDHQKTLISEIGRLSKLLGLRTGLFNIETRVGQDGKPYIMEMSPRGGGNRLSEMLRYASGIDLIRASVQASLGMEVQDVRTPQYDGVWYQLMIHSVREGVFRGIEYADGFRDKHVVDEQLWIDPGERVEAFTGANHAFGSIIMRFGSLEEAKGVFEEGASAVEVVVS